ncbi:hypothetical protein [Natrialba swarupiae]|uniref:Uncharacterized protein n=1 Tax=Natrialba swarupiae TaxID=2448032 RepID=A0A5D5AQ25_9EURY|nr:hypothetical protein [Natrialba swarupiae]TYT63958.1 hypothetical protein FYC77_01770 [Natrialba swarupiae]
MKRRTMLTAVGGGVVATAGCLASIPAGDDDSEPEYGIEIETDDALEAVDIGFGVEVEEGATPESPAKLNITMYNHAGDGATSFAQTVETGPDPPFSGRIGENENDDRLVLEPILIEGDDTRGEHVDGDCWRASSWLLESILEYAEGEGGSISLDASGGLYLTYYLLVHPDADGCMPAGTYRFESDQYGVDDHTWGFDLTLLEPITATASTDAESD